MVLMRHFITENLKSKIAFMETLTLFFYFLARTGISLKEPGTPILYTIKTRKRTPFSGFGFLCKIIL